MVTELDKNTALILIDLQKGILKTEKAHPIKNVLEKAAILTKAFRMAGLPVVIVHVNPVGAPWTKARVDQRSAPQSTIMQTVAKVTMPISGFTDIVPEIVVKPGDILIEKKNWNAFFQTDLHEQLQKRKITGIVLAGVSTSIGVEGTARAASELGYNITFASDATTDNSLGGYQHSFTNIFPRIGEIGSVMDILSFLPVGR